MFFGLNCRLLGDTLKDKKWYCFDCGLHVRRLLNPFSKVSIRPVANTVTAICTTTARKLLQGKVKDKLINHL